MSRRMLLAAAMGLGLLWLFPPEMAAAAPRLDAGVIKAGLRTAAPEEDGFVERVVELVDQGVLPASLVDSTFEWARKKTSHRFQYFKKAMILRASRIGVRL